MNIRSYTVYIYGPGQPYTSGRTNRDGLTTLMITGSRLLSHIAAPNASLTCVF